MGLDAEQYMPLCALNPFVYEWLIKVRVTRKYEMRTWQNANGSGEILTIELTDARGDMIQGSFFSQVAIRFYAKITQGKVYLVSNGQVVMSNKKFTSIKHDYYIRFNESTEFKEVPDDPKIGHQTF